MLDTIINFISFLAVIGLGYALGWLVANRRLARKVVDLENALTHATEALERVIADKVVIEIVDDVDWDAELKELPRKGER